MSSLRPSFAITPESLLEVLGDMANQVMVYGFEFTKYKHISEALESGRCRVQKVFGATLGSEGNPEWRTTAEGSVVETFQTNSTHHSRQKVSRECKSAITALIYENYKRKKHGLPIIPFLFCLEYSDGAGSGVIKTSPRHVATKEKQFNELITHSELRRVYKHCKEFERSDLPELRELSQVAQESLKFVRVEKVGVGLYKLVSIRPIWEDKDWEAVWQKRLGTDPEARKETTQRKENRWREQLLREFNRSVFQKAPI